MVKRVRGFICLLTLMVCQLLVLQSVAQHAQHVQAKADSLLNFAEARFQHDLGSALAATDQAIMLAEEHKLPLTSCKAHNRLGILYNHIGFYARALAEFHQALQLAQQHQLPDLQADALVNIGNVYYYEDSLDRALSYYEKSLQLNEETRNLRVLARNLNNIGSVNNRLGNYALANKNIRKALALNLKLGNLNSATINYDNLGNVYYHLLQYDTALYYYDKGISLAKEQENFSSLVYLHLGKARVFRKQGKREAEEALLLGVLPYSEQTASHAATKRILEQLSELEELKGDYSAALAYQRKHNKLSDSLYTITQSSEQKRLLELLEAEKKIGENHILKANVAARELELEATVANHQKQVAITLSTIIALVMLAALMAFLYYHYHQQKKNHQALKKMHEAIQAQALELEKAYDQIHTHNLELENSIVERTRQLNQQNRQLIQYAFFNAHKVRGPLARILGLVNLMPKAEHETEFQFILQRLEESARELDGVVHEINLILETKQVHQDN